MYMKEVSAGEEKSSVVPEDELLEHSEIMRLVAESQKGDINARQILVSRNMGLVRSVVRKYRDSGKEQDDLIQLGCMGLLKAILRFDMNFNVKFSTYAVPKIEGEIKRYLRDDGIIRVSRSLKEKGLKIKKEKELFLKQYGKDASSSEIAKRLDMDVKEVIDVEKSNLYIESIDECRESEDGGTINYVDLMRINERDESDYTVDRLYLETLINRIPMKSRTVIRQKYFMDKTQNEIGNCLGVSQVQISRMEKKAIETMRKLAETDVKYEKGII